MTDQPAPLQTEFLQTPLDWSDRLSPEDLMLYRSDMDTRQRSTMISIEIVDAVPDYDRLCADMERTSRVALRFRQRVVAPIVPITPARWVTDPDFDIRHHVRRISLPGDNTMRGVLDFAQHWLMDPLDPNRPLWEVTLIEGIDAAGPAALVWKLSHAVTDGMGSVAMDRAMRTDVPDPVWTAPPIPIPQDLSGLDLTVSGAVGLPVSLVGKTVRTVRSATRFGLDSLRAPAARLRQATELVATMQRMTALESASPMLTGRSLRRRFETLQCSFAELRAASKTQHCSLNDAYLSVISGAMRHYHHGLGVPVDAVSLGLPISIRPSGDAGGGNQISSAVLALPADIDDPADRMLAIHELVLTARSDSRFNPLAMIAPIANWLPQALMAGGGSPVDIQASNVPGNPRKRYIAGVGSLSMMGFGPLPGAGMMITMMTNVGRCDIGINYDPAAFTDGDLLMRSFEQSLEEVLALGRQAPAADPPATPAKSTTTKAVPKPAAKKATPKPRTRPPRPPRRPHHARPSRRPPPRRRPPNPRTRPPRRRPLRSPPRRWPSSARPPSSRPPPRG